MKVITRKEAKAQGLKRYFTGVACKHGHTSERSVSSKGCFSCVSDRHKKYRLENIDKHRAIDANYYKNNKEACIARQVEYIRKNNGKIKEFKANNPMITFARDCKSRINAIQVKSSLKRKEIEQGYTQEQFIQHIESQFIDGMTWGNRNEWHIDHIKPISLFLKEGVTDPNIINALSNLQPLWAKDNLSKGAKFEG